MKVLINTLTADLFLKLYTSVGWIAPCKEQVERALENTLASKNGFEERPCEWDVHLRQSLYVDGDCTCRRFFNALSKSCTR